MYRTFITYRGAEVNVKILSIYEGGQYLMAGVEAVEGFPFLSSDAQAQGETQGAWNSNGYRIRADALHYAPVELGSKEWFASISPIPF